MDDGNGLDRVREILAAPEDVDMPEGLAPPPGDEGASPGHDAPGWDGVGRGEPPADDTDAAEPPPEARCVDFPLNDYGNGQRLAEHFGADLRAVPRVGFFTWSGQRWQIDPDGIEVRRMAHQMTELIARETWHMPLPDGEAQVLSAAEDAARVLDELGVIPPKDRSDDQILQMAQAARLVAEAKDIKDRRDKSIGRRLTHAKNAGNTNAIKNMLTEVAVIRSTPLDALDAGPMDINTESGVLRFWRRPGEDDGGQNPAPPMAGFDVLPHDRDQLLTKIMPVIYDPDARCPDFLAFLERIMPAAEMRRFLQRWFGYSMTGLTSEQVFAFLYGAGANGKSVLVDLMAKLLGDYAASAKIESLTGRNRRGGGDATPDLVPLIGARMVRASEPDEGERLQEALIKELTGGEPILVRALNENFVLVYPIFKLTISGNHKPEIRGGDDGIWRRVLLVPFEVQIPKEERDPELGAKLWSERSGILNWLIEGLTDYLQHGLQVPQTVLAATEEYRADSDPIATFLSTVCGVSGDPRHNMRAADLAAAVAFWMDEQALGAWTPRTISKRLAAKQGKWRHPASAQSFHRRKSSDAYFDGISLLDPFRSRFEEHRNRQSPRGPAQGSFDD